MDNIEYDKIELQFEEFSIMLPNSTIEKFQIEKVEQLIEKKYETQEVYNVYIVINKILAEAAWDKELEDIRSYYKTFTDCINSNYIYEINRYKEDKIVETILPVWTYTQFKNEYQKIGITNDKIIIRIKEI